MHIILVRHAEAVAIGEDGVTTDYDRHLTALGQDQAGRLATALEDRKVVPTLVVSSPLVRAKQTAEPLMRLLPITTGEPLYCDYLATGSMKRRKLTKYLEELNPDVAMLVGHNPELSEYAAWLIGAADDAVPLEKAGAAAIRFDDAPGKGRGALEWLVTPEWFM
jgi:phosphohistidine phosphatase